MHSSAVAMGAALSITLAACDKDPLRSPPPLGAPRAAIATCTTSFGTPCLTPSQGAADAISANIRRRHTPYGTVIDPRFASADPTSPGYDVLAPNGYTRAGDAAIWTGHYLAAEAVRYKVTRSSDALAAVRSALGGITSLVDVTGRGLLARFAIPTSSPYAGPVTQEEAHNGIYGATLGGQSYYWIGKTTRDQYSGVFFGLATAYDMVDDAAVKAQVATLVGRMLDYLLKNGWFVIMPNGTISTTFVGRADQQLSLLQVGRHVNPAKYAATYQSYRQKYAGLVGVPIAAECGDTYGSYFKFNLDYINLYDLIRLEESSSPYLVSYALAYVALRDCTRAHGNAQFNMVDRGLRGADAARDAQTGTLLGLWLARPSRDVFVDLTAYAASVGIATTCGPNGNEACAPLPVDRRVNTDFLWQRSPFGIKGGTGLVETAGIDYLLSYWMARYYGVLTS